jgi:hypothetical protein
MCLARLLLIKIREGVCIQGQPRTMEAKPKGRGEEPEARGQFLIRDRAKEKRAEECKFHDK